MARYYVQMRLLPGADPRGPATVCSHEQLVRLQVIALLRRRDRLSIPKIRKRIASLSLPDLEGLLPKPEPPPLVVVAPDPIAATSVRWDHVTLLPGLELRVRVDAGPIVHRLAREIVTTYGTDATTPTER